MTKESNQNGKRQDELIEELIARNRHGRKAVLVPNGLVAQWIQTKVGHRPVGTPETNRTRLQLFAARFSYRSMTARE